MKRNFSKKALCLVLCLLMLSSVLLTSCVEEEVDVADGRTTRSVVIAMVSEKEVSPETEKQIEDALNAITKSKYKTMVDIRYYSQEEYFSEMVALVERIEEDRANSEGDDILLDTPETESADEETVVDEFYGYAEYKYPEIKENQLDIFYIAGLDMYKYFNDFDNERAWLAPLDSELSTMGSLLYDYIFDSYMKGLITASYDTTYAIPNNVLSGEYTYLLVDKTLATKYQYAVEVPSWTSITDAESFISDIAKYEPSVVPVYGDLVPTNTHSWNYKAGSMGDITTYTNQAGKFSIFTSKVSTDATIESPLVIEKSLNLNYGKQLKTIQMFKDNNYVTTELKEGQKFAVGFMKGNEATIENYRDDYEILVLEKPKITTYDLFDNMFGIYANSENETTRNMEILMLLYTNEEFRNIIQYGIEGVHYTIDDKTGVLKRLNQDYMMDINKTGNVLIAHAEEGVDPNSIKYLKAALMDATVYPGVSFNCSSVLGVVTELVEAENALSKKYEEKLAACKNLADLEAVIAEYNADPEVSALFERWTSPQDGANSPYSAYYRWMVNMGYIVEDL